MSRAECSTFTEEFTCGWPSLESTGRVPRRPHWGAQDACRDALTGEHRTTGALHDDFAAEPAIRWFPHPYTREPSRHINAARKHADVSSSPTLNTPTYPLPQR